MTVVSLLLDSYRISNGGRLICHKRPSNSLFGKHFLGAAREDDGSVGGDRVEIAHGAGRVTAFAGSSRCLWVNGPVKFPSLIQEAPATSHRLIDVGLAGPAR